MAARARAEPRGERGQALPLALIALALGATLVTPFLWSASTHLLASRQIDAAIVEGYSSDAGVEWALWRLSADPALTSSTTFTSAPLEPTPAAVNGGSFPLVEIRLVASGALETTTSPWQNGSGAKCYPLTSTGEGTVYARIESGASNLRADLRTSCDGSGLPSLPGSSPYILEFPARPPGDHWLVVRGAGQTPGSLELSYPLASYEIRSQLGGQTVTARASAGASAVEVLSWQLD